VPGQDEGLVFVAMPIQHVELKGMWQAMSHSSLADLAMSPPLYLLIDPKLPDADYTIIDVWPLLVLVSHSLQLR
jgi:hypothetical protein